jgi:hypothetical protein
MNCPKQRKPLACGSGEACYAASMRGQAVLVGALALGLGALAYRQHVLERELDALSRQLGAENGEAGEAPSTAASAERESQVTRSHASRLAALENELRAARSDLRALQQTAAREASPANDQQILSVMRQYGNKVLDSQLKFHRERWLEQRETQLNELSRRFGLSQKENDELWELLADEIDKMVELIRRPELAEDPERAARLWRELLLDTDAQAHRILDPQKSLIWDQARFVERKLLWPWLPD